MLRSCTATASAIRYSGSLSGRGLPPLPEELVILLLNVGGVGEHDGAQSRVAGVA